MVESRQGKDYVMPIAEARGLRDELAKILLEMREFNKQQAAIEPTISIEMQGGTFK